MDKFVLVAGGSGDIGRSISAIFLKEGFNVVLVGRDSEKGRVVLEHLNRFVTRNQLLEFFSIDLSCQIDVKKFSKYILSNFGRVNILVNCVGMIKDGLLLNVSKKDWSQMISCNLDVMYNLTKSFLSHMLCNKSGSIINVSSVRGIFGGVGQSVYAATKGGVIAFTKSLAKEVGRKNIRVNCVAPGFIDGGGLQNKGNLSRIPMGRYGRSDEVAEVVLFLSKASYVNGEVVVVDGGMSA